MVAWLNSTPSSNGRQAFVSRGFRVDEYTSKQLQDPNNLAGLAAVVFIQHAEKPTQISKQLEAHIKLLLDYDCRIILRSASKETTPGSKELIQFDSIITNTLSRLRIPTGSVPFREASKFNAWQRYEDGDPPLPHAHIFSHNASWNVIANFVAEHPPDKAPNPYLNILINGKPPKYLRCSREILLRRAFWNCSEVDLIPESEGKSGVDVYRAYADLESGHFGPWPLPYFVKIGERNKILVEYENYKNHVDPYIPFHLGPHLIHERCGLGACEGIIVGDYVEESESLKACARDGRAAQAISSLFHTTLHGWYRNTNQTDAPLSTHFNFPEFKSKDAKSRIEKAKELGAQKSPDQLFELFKRSDSALPVLMGPIHGDLHANNIRVRVTDAIVIDFVAYKNKPLVYDAACLEASLLVEGFSDFDINDDVLLWMGALQPFYEHPKLLEMRIHHHPKHESSWFYACIRQIRLYARQMECCANQYAATLALALLKKSSKDLTVAGSESIRRAAAYVFAEKVLVSTFGENHEHSNAAA